MRRTLYRKLILIYVILAIAGFTLISTVGSRMVEDSLVSSASTSLYREATQIASKQGDLYYHSERSLTDLYNSLSALASYHNSQIWLISADGEMLSVMVPVTSDFRINGYVAIHLPLQDVYQQRESLLARIDFLFLLVFGLSFVILIFFSLVVYRPLKKIINGAKEYASGNRRIPAEFCGERLSRLPLTADLDQRLCGGNPRRNDSAGNAGKISENRSV